ncbi:MAG: NAD(+)/NADH kinase [Anaerolineales bacterium]
MPIPRRVAVAIHPDMKPAAELAAQIEGWLIERQVKIVSSFLYDEAFRSQIAKNEFDLLIMLGGDGGMLRAGHLCAPNHLPILGINLGRLGFLIEVQRDDWQSALERILAGDYWLEQRMMLRAEHHRDGQVLGQWQVLNEFFIGRGEIVRPVRLRTEVDKRHLTTYVADAVIVSTPTGSTAYALAAGGPVLPPDLRNILIVPVAPHLTFDRAVVLHEGSWVQVTVYTDHQAMLSADGQEPVPLADGDSVLISASEDIAEFVRFQDPDYFYRNVNKRMNQNPSAGVDL